MLKIISAGVLFFFLILPGCKKTDDDILLEKNFTFFFNVPAGLNSVETHYFQLPDQNIDILQDLINHNLDSNALNAIVTGAASLHTQENVDLNFIDELIVEYYRMENPDIDLEAAYWDRRQEIKGRDLELTPSLTDLSSILQSGNYGVRLGFRFERVPLEELNYRLDIKLLYK